MQRSRTNWLYTKNLCWISLTLHYCNVLVLPADWRNVYTSGGVLLTLDRGIFFKTIIGYRKSHFLGHHSKQEKHFPIQNYWDECDSIRHHTVSFFEIYLTKLNYRWRSPHNIKWITDIAKCTVLLSTSRHTENFILVRLRVHLLYHSRNYGRHESSVLSHAFRFCYQCCLLRT